ncbi:MAG TPA: hypothetical protein PLL72_03185 [Burkholderiaceae bacterium]|nr:hypothetical protein [Burkholderiaceae bacterium]
MNYSYGNKSQWRRWVWNRISERSQTRAGFILALAAEEALDIPVAKRHGFDVRNFIAIDRDPSALQALRAQNKLAIQGDVWATLHAWPADRRVCCVVADLCGGLTKANYSGLFQALMNPALFESVFVVNMLRGRDDAELVRLAEQLYDEARKSGDDVDRFQLASVQMLSKHRGGALAICLCGAIAESICKASDDVDAVNWLAHLCEELESAVYSYRSTAGNQWFDTVVFLNPMRFLKEASLAISKIYGRSPEHGQQRRRTAAVLAHHTRRFKRAGTAQPPEGPKTP